jgi:hypothetical protein
MESRSIKIKDYVTHERVPVRGDSHGNFTLSPLGFPFVNRSGYMPGVPGSVPPTTFSADMLVKPDLTKDEPENFYFLEYKDHFDFPRTDSDHDTFIVTAKLIEDETGYIISSEHANFTAGCYVSIAVSDSTYESLNRDFTLDKDNHIPIEPISPSAEEGIECTVTFRPERTETDDEHPLFIKFTGSGDNNGTYKLFVDDSDSSGILHYTWMYKTSNEVKCDPENAVTFDGTENDNVRGHYRNRVSDEEVADYLNNVLGAAIECGKFRGAEYPVDAHGLLVKWFLSRGAIVHSVAGKTVVIDGFGHVLDTTGLGDCSGTPATDEQGPYNIGVLNDWLMSTAGTNDYEDYPSEELTGGNNNISLEVEKSGERHTFVIQQDLANMVQTPPRKTFIHLPAGVDLADGTEIELNVALPVITQPGTVGQTDTNVKEALKSFTDYVSQPMVYILSGKQTPLPNNSVLNSGITTSGDSFTIVPKHPYMIENGSIAFGLYNRYECSKTFRFSGNATTHQLNDGAFVNQDHSKVMFDTVEEVSEVGDYILLKYDVMTPVIGKVTELKETSVVVDFGREMKMPYDGYYEVEYNGARRNMTLVEGDAPLYDIDVDPTGIAVDDLLEFDVLEGHEEEKLIVSKKTTGETTTFGFSSPVSSEPDDVIHGFFTSIEVTDKAFPYDVHSRRWLMYSKDATCMVDVRAVDDQDGLTEHTEDSGAFDTEKTLEDLKPYYTEPKLIDNDSIIATIYPTSTNTFPWRLNGRNRVRHLGLTSNANVDYVEGGDKPLTRLVFEMNEGVYSGISGMFRGYHPISELRYCESNNDTAEGNSVLGSLLRVYLPQTLDADVDEEHKDDIYVVRRATKAFHDLIGDFKVARVGYTSSRTLENKKNTKWGDGSDTPSPVTSGTNNLHRLNDWETKIIHLPNYCLGVDASLERNLAYAGWNKDTYGDNFRIFYDRRVDPFVEWDGFGPFMVGNRRYSDFKDNSGTTQRTVDNYADEADGDVPFNYTAENSVFKLFITDANEQTRNQYGAFVHGLLELPIIKRGLQSISWLAVEEGEETDALKRECEFANRDMEPFYPMSHVMSTDGVAFPDVSRNALRAVAKMDDEDVKRALLAIPDKVVIYNDRVIQDKSLTAELISVNIPDEGIDENPAVEYMKSLLTMYSNGMPLHMYDAHRAINVNSPSGPYGDLLQVHEVDEYNRHGSLQNHEQHKYCDLATVSGQETEDVNMTYNFISDSAIDPQDAPMSLTTPLENVSATFIKNVFTGMYTRVHVKAMFSSSLGRWVVKDYRQYPSCYLTPLYGAKTLDYTEKSYSYGNPKKYANRVPMSEGVENKKFTVSKYIAACPEQPLWQMPCGVGSDYIDAMNKRYVDVPPMEMNPGCVPFLLESFPYDDDGKVNNSVKFRNLYESVSTPMDANGDPKEGSVPEVNFWNIKLHIRPARSAYPGADIPSNSARTGGTLGEPTLGMFNDPITI